MNCVESDTPLEVQAWIRAIESDQTLCLSSPLVLPNGEQVTTLTGVCSACNQAIEPAMVRGRLLWSLPTVATVEGNGYCSTCQRITHLHC